MIGKTGWACVLLAVSIAPALLADDLAADDPAADFSPASDRPDVLRPARPRSEADQDRIDANAQYVQGRLLLGRGDKAEALVRYERAWRYGLGEASLLREIVPLAFDLKRNDEAARYAVLAAEADPTDAVLLRRLALYLSERRDLPRAIKLFEKSLAADRPTAQPDLTRKPDLAELTIHFELGRLYFLIDEFTKSAESFAKVRDALVDPQSSLSDAARQTLLGKPERTYALVAEALFEARRYDEAADLFRKLNGLKPDAPELAFNLARIEAARNDSSAALARLEEYFAAKSSSAGVEPYELLGRLIAKSSAQADEARKTTIDRLETLHQADPENDALAAVLADQYFQSERLADAERLYAAVLTRQPTGKTYRRLVEIYRKQDQPDRLLATIGKLAAKTGSLDGLQATGKSLAADAALVNQLIERTREQQKNKPDSLADGQLLAMALLARAGKQFDAADELLAAALPGIKPSPAETLIQWGLGMLGAEEPERAAKAFQRVLDEQLLPGGEASVQFYLAGALELAGQTDQAVVAAQRAAELSPANARFASRKAWILYHAKRLDAAREAYAALIDQYGRRYDDSDVRGVVREARLALSHIEVLASNFPAAVEWLEQVLDEYPEDVGAGNDLGYLWAERGLHLQRSLRMIERAVAAEPKNTAYRDSLGWVFFQLGRVAEAEKELAIAAGSDEPDGVILDHWGDALAKLGRRDEALAAWRRAEAAFQKSGEAGKLEAVRKKLNDTEK